MVHNKCAAASVFVCAPLHIDFLICCFPGLYTFMKLQIHDICLLQPYIFGQEFSSDLSMETANVLQGW